MKRFGVICKGSQYSLPEVLWLIEQLGGWQANLLIWGEIAWKESNKDLVSEHLKRVELVVRACREQNLEFWVSIKPGDRRYCHHKSDRDKFLKNIGTYLEMGVDGIYLAMDDMHPKRDNVPFSRVSLEDAPSHARLVREIQEDFPQALKAVCFQQYHGTSFEACRSYWNYFLDILDAEVMITWTGPEVWNRRMSAEDFSWIERPVMLFDNYYANTSREIRRSPTHPYRGREKELCDVLEAVVINPHRDLFWQYCGLSTAMQFYLDPEGYDPDLAFSKAIVDLSDKYRKIRLETVR